MDILAHGLWTAVVYSKIKLRDRIWAVFFGIAPDLFSFGWFLVASFFTSAWHDGPPDITQVPGYVFTLYNIGHSIFTWLAIFVLVWLINQKPWWPLAGALLHITIDVPLHEADFFPTPWLWPVSTYTVNGISWAQPVFMLTNYSLLAITYIMWVIWRYQKAKL